MTTRNGRQGYVVVVERWGSGASDIIGTFGTYWGYDKALARAKRIEEKFPGVVATPSPITLGGIAAIEELLK